MNIVSLWVGIPNVNFQGHEVYARAGVRDTNKMKTKNLDVNGGQMFLEMRVVHSLTASTGTGQGALGRHASARAFVCLTASCAHSYGDQMCTPASPSEDAGARCASGQTTPALILFFENPKRPSASRVEHLKELWIIPATEKGEIREEGLARAHLTLKMKKVIHQSGPRQKTPEQEVTTVTGASTVCVRIRKIHQRRAHAEDPANLSDVRRRNSCATCPKTRRSGITHTHTQNPLPGAAADERMRGFSG